MGDFFVIIGFALTVAVLTVLLKDSKAPVFALLVAVAGGAMIFIVLLPRIADIFAVLNELADRAGLNRLYLQTILKIIAVSYLAEFAAQVCRDAGVSALASKIDLAAKIVVMMLGLPIMVAILDTILQLIP